LRCVNRRRPRGHGAADEQAIALLPAGAWKPGIAQDGTVEEDKDVAEITHLLSRAGNWPDGPRWIARRGPHREGHGPTRS
jgi:hypothetical protein